MNRVRHRIPFLVATACLLLWGTASLVPADTTREVMTSAPSGQGMIARDMPVTPAAGTVRDVYPVMRPDRHTRLQWITGYRQAPFQRMEPRLGTRRGAMSLLEHLVYDPAERDQGACGNCWAWAGTGALEIAMDVENGLRDRLSVQYINSCEASVIGKDCCDGGWLPDLTNFYNAVRQVVPWSNDQAWWHDGDASCELPCEAIATSPSYPVSELRALAVQTQGVGRATAIANIKNALDQGKAVWFGLLMPRQADWDALFTLWDEEPVSTIWNPGASCGEIWEPDGGGGHAILIVGYDDEDPDPANHYWVALNSWGMIEDLRPQGLIRVAMEMDYDCYFIDEGEAYPSLYFMTLEADFSTVWHQPASTDNTNIYADQDFEEELSQYDIYLADDFTLEEPATIHRLFIPGGLWNGGTTLANASSLNWEIYADAGGIPAGTPSGAGDEPVWRISLPPSAGQVEIGTGSGGLPSDVTLTESIHLDAGTYWLVFYPSLDFGIGGGQYGRRVSETTNGYVAKVLATGGGYAGFPAEWTDVTEVPWDTGILAEQDLAFTVTTEGGPPPLPNTLAVDFGNFGLWMFSASDDEWIWGMNLNAEDLCPLPGGLAMDLGPAGLWAIDAERVNRVCGGNPDNSGNTMAAYGSLLAVDLGFLGFYVYDPFTPPQPGDMKWWADVEFICPYGGNKIALDVGTAGLWLWDGEERRLLALGNPTNTGSNIVAYRDGFVVEFNYYLVYYDETVGWKPLFSQPVEYFCTYGSNNEKLAVDVANGGGLWSYDGSSWTRLSTFDPDNEDNTNTMVAWRDGLAVDMGWRGLYYFKDGRQEQLMPLDVEYLCPFQGGLAVDMGPYGLWRYDGYSWDCLAWGLDPDNAPGGATMVACDLE